MSYSCLICPTLRVCKFNPITVIAKDESNNLSISTCVLPWRAVRQPIQVCIGILAQLEAEGKLFREAFQPSYKICSTKRIAWPTWGFAICVAKTVAIFNIFYLSFIFYPKVSLNTLVHRAPSFLILCNIAFVHCFCRMQFDSLTEYDLWFCS